MSQKERERIRQFTLPHLGETECANLSKAVVQAICEKHLVQRCSESPVVLVESLAIHPEAIPDSFNLDELAGGCSTIPCFTHADLKDEQQRVDPAI